MATASKTFYGTSTFTAPAGVTSVVVQANYNSRPFAALAGCFVDPFLNVYSWGANNNGRLGDGTIVAKSSPVLVLGGLQFSKVFCANQGNGMLGLTPAGVLYGWGNNGFGILGVGDIAPRSSPVQVVGGQTFQSVAVGAGTSVGSVYALNTAGQCFAWGQGTAGQLGDNTIVSKSSPVLVVGGLTFVKIAATTNGGSAHGLTTSGTIYSWGSTPMMGDNTSTGKSSPVPVVGGITNFVDVVGSDSSVYGLTADGKIYAWGVNSQGQLGTNDVVPRSSPTLVVGNQKWQSVICPVAAQGGTAWVFALATTGDLYGWGVNGSSGILGDNTTVASRSSPTLVVGGLKFKKVVSSGAALTLGLTGDGKLYGWGQNGAGQLGDNTTTFRSSPVQVVGGLTFADMTLMFSQSTSFAMTIDGKVYAWGQNTNGEIGDNTTAAKSSPTLVVGARAGNAASTYTQILAPTVPGTTYSISFLPTLVTFGTFNVGNGQADSVTVYYDQ